MNHIVGIFCDWLSATPVSQFIQNVSWIIPMVQSTHIMSVAVVVGSVLMIDLKLLGYAGAGASVTDELRRYSPWLWRALTVLLATGLILTCAEPRRELLNVVFLIKMALIAVVSGAAIGFQRIVRHNAEAWGDHPADIPLARWIALGNLPIWVAIIICGRWIAYAPHG